MPFHSVFSTMADFSLPLPSGSAPPRRVRVTQTVYISLINLPFSSSHLSVFLSATNRVRTSKKQPMIHVFLFAIHRQRSRLFHLIPPSLHTSAHISHPFSLFSFLHFFFCLMHIPNVCDPYLLVLCLFFSFLVTRQWCYIFVPYPLRATVTHFVFTFLFFILYATLPCTATPSLRARLRYKSNNVLRIMML